jgi:outer membrane autotransporter protein
MTVAVSSVLAITSISTQFVHGADYEKLEVSSQQGESLRLDGVRVDFTGSGPGVRISGSQNQLQGYGYEINANAIPNHAVVGVQIEAGANAELSHVSIATGGSVSADGALVTGVGSRLTLSDVQITTSGLVSRGVVTTNGGEAKVVGGSIRTSGDRAAALSASGKGSSIQASDMTLFSSAAWDGTLVRAADGATIVLDNGIVYTPGSMGALSVEGTGSSISANGIDLTATAGQGVRVNSGALIFSNGNINSKRDGILLEGSSKNPGGVLDVSNSGIVSQDGFGINVNADGGTADLDNVRITTQGDHGSGIWAPGSDGRVNLKDSVIETFGSQAVGIDNRASKVRMTGGGIITHGNGSYALYASADNGKNPSAEFDITAAHIETFGRNSVGVMARRGGAKINVSDSSIETHGASAHGLFASGQGASITLIDSQLSTEGVSAYGLAISNNASSRFQGVNLLTSGAEAHGIFSYATGTGVVNDVEVNASRIETKDGVGVYVNGGSLNIRFADSHLLAHSAGAPSSALLMSDSTDGVLVGNVELDAVRSTIFGDIMVNAGTLQLGLGDHSSLQGAILGNGQSARLDIDGSSFWKLTGDSNLSRMTNAGVVEFAHTGQGQFKQLSVAGDLTGNGLYIINTDLGLHTGDRLLIGGQVIGHNQILVRNSGAEPGASVQHLPLVESAGGPGSFSLSNAGGVVDAGTFRYELQGDAQSGDWSLVNVGGNEQLPKPGPDNLSTGASAAINSSAIDTVRGTWDAERATLIQRVGEPRASSGSQGLWIRSLGQRQSLDNGVGRDFSQQVQGTQLGIDTRIVTAKGALVVGGLAGYSQTDRNFKGEGRGSLDSYHVGAYATYLDDSDWYTDSLLTLNRWSSRLDMHSTDGAKVSGRSRNHGGGVSVEAGKHINLDDGWFVEPLVQVSVLYVAADSYSLDNGLRVEAGDGLSTQIRAGARTGRRLQLANGMRLQPYLKAGWVEDFSSQKTIQTNGISSHLDDSGGKWYAGGGMSGELNGGHQVYVEVETSEGSGIDRPWAANLGYRVSW